MDELNLYKLITSPLVDEFHHNEDNFIILISYYNLTEFIAKLTEIFGERLYNDGSFDAKIMNTYLGIDLHKALDDYINLDEIFPHET